MDKEGILLKEEILLKEYETCQYHISHISSQFWLVTGIFISISTAVMGGLVYALVQNTGNILIPGHYNALVCSPVILFKLVVILFLSIGMIVIIRQLLRWHKRGNFTTRMCYYRMQRIENQLKMQRGLVIDSWDKQWDKIKLSRSDRKKFKKKFEEKHHFDYEPPSGLQVARRMFQVLIVLWSLVAATVTYGILYYFL